ncbi:MAG: hypothetical protein GEV13_19160 [Rhodospirillales bacterium]|nr:hypothetical protein [Rhodospirillales bacterium]
MTKSLTLFARAAAAIAAIAMASPSTASAICWIERVERTKAGVKVFFGDRRPVWIIRPGQRLTIVDVDQAGSAEPASGNRPARVRWVEGVPGDLFRVQNSHHDSCRLTVARQGDKLGLWAEAQLSLPGTPSHETAKFIAAQ